MGKAKAACPHARPALKWTAMVVSGVYKEMPLGRSRQLSMRAIRLFLRKWSRDVRPFEVWELRRWRDGDPYKPSWPILVHYTVQVPLLPTACFYGILRNSNLDIYLSRLQLRRFVCLQCTVGVTRQASTGNCQEYGNSCVLLRCVQGLRPFLALSCLRSFC